MAKPLIDGITVVFGKAPTSEADKVISAVNALPLILRELGTLLSISDCMLLILVLITLFYTGFVLVELSAVSTTVLLAPFSIDANLSFSAVV